MDVAPPRKSINVLLRESPRKTRKPRLTNQILLGLENVLKNRIRCADAPVKVVRHHAVEQMDVMEIRRWGSISSYLQALVFPQYVSYFDNNGIPVDGNEVEIQGFEAITASTDEEYMYRNRVIIPSLRDTCPFVWGKGPDRGRGGRRIGDWIPIRDSILTTLINDNIRYTVKSLFEDQEETEEMERELKEQEEAQRRWEARLKEIKSNGGQKYIDAFGRFEITVGMPKDLTMVVINRYYRIDRQYESGNSRTLVCVGRLDPNHWLWVSFSSNRVSSIST